MIADFQKAGASLELSTIVVELLAAVAEIADMIDQTSEGKAGTQNAYGEEQAAMDVKAESILQATLKSCPFVGLIGSEELDEPLAGHEAGAYSVFYDPLDGSSLLDVNQSIGTIVGIYDSLDVIGKTAASQVAALFAVYGPRTTVMLTLGKGVVELAYEDGVWVVKQESVNLTGQKNYFAPGNLRACKEREDYFDLVSQYVMEQYTLRYSGGMVPDINHLLKKGSGVFLYPGMPSQPDGKLRLLYECGPMAFIMEQAGGAASDGVQRILDLPIENYTQTTPIYIGVKAEVERAASALGR